MDPQLSNNIEKLVQSIAQGDTDAYHELYNQLHKPLFGFVVARTSSREDAKDVLQDVFIDLWHALQKFSYHSDKQFFSFVYTIAKRKLARYYKSHIKTVPLPLIDENLTECYEITDIDTMAILKVLSKLKPKYREVIELRYISDLKFVDIAKFLNTKETTVKVRHHRALKQLNVLLQEYGT